MPFTLSSCGYLSDCGGCTTSFSDQSRSGSYALPSGCILAQTRLVALLDYLQHRDDQQLLQGPWTYARDMLFQCSPYRSSSPGSLKTSSTRFKAVLENNPLLSKFKRPHETPDMLFKSNIIHQPGGYVLYCAYGPSNLGFDILEAAVTTSSIMVTRTQSTPD